MRLRRVIAVAAGALVLQLGFVAGESRCDPPSPAPAEHHQQHSPQSTAPTIPVCCQALPSCGVTVAVTSPAAAWLGGAPRISSMIDAEGSHGTLATAPEAPPPKA